MKKFLLSVSFALAACALRGQSPRLALSFASYPVHSVFEGHAAKPKFRPGADAWPDANGRFRDTVQFYLDRGPNFAGHYAIVETTCGTGCGYVVVVDVRTGQIFENLPFRQIDITDFFTHDYRGLIFRLRSKLLIVEGYVDGSGTPTRAYYEWIGNNFRLIKKSAIAER
jgi:hypothetical protein